MPKNPNILKFAYDSAYDFKMKKKDYSISTYNAGGDLSKRWYVYYSVRNPKTGLLERQPTIDTGVNIYKTFKERTNALNKLRKAVELALQEGYSPFAKSIVNQIENKQYTISEAFDYIRKKGELVLAKTSFPDFRSRVNRFERWLNEIGCTDLKMITRKVAANYLNKVEEESSESNKNNTKANLSMAFSYLKQDFIIDRNVFEEIKGRKTEPKRHRTYSSEMETKIFERLSETDKILELFVMFVSYGFLRPIEVCRITIGSIDIKDKHIRFKAKNKKDKLKIIPDILIERLPDLSLYEKDMYLFTPTGVGYWDAEEENRRDYFTKRFNTIIKKHFELGRDYTMYSHRHTSATKIYNELIKKMSYNEAIDTVSLIIGHKSRTSTLKYLRDIDAILPDDYSRYLIK